MEKSEVEIELRNPYFLVLLGFLIVILYFELNVTINSPIAFGDEGYHTQLAKLIAENKEYFVWMPFEGNKVENQGFWRPPLWNLLEGSFYLIFGFNPTIVEILTPLITLLTGLAAFPLFKKIFNQQIGFITAVILVTIPSVVTYSDLFYVDTLLVFWVTLFLGFFLLYTKTDSKKYLVGSTIFAAFAIYTKTTGYALIFFYGFYFLYELYKTKDFKIIKKYLAIAGLLALFLGGFYLRNIYYYKTPICASEISFLIPINGCNINANYVPKVSFIGTSAPSGTDQSVYALGLIQYLQFAYGYIWFIPLALSIGAVLFLLQKEKLTLAALIFFVATLPVFYLTYKTRAEDAARYTLVAVPVIALISAAYLDVLVEFLKKYNKYLPVTFILAILAVSFLNFYSKNSTMSSVKQFSPLFFQACGWVQNNLPQNATLLSLYGHPTVYNCNRNAVWVLQDLPDIILSNNLNLTMTRLKVDGINYIFVQKFALGTQNYQQTYPISFVQFLDQYPQQFVKVYENGPQLSVCLGQGGCDGSLIYFVNTTGV